MTINPIGIKIAANSVRLNQYSTAKSVDSHVSMIKRSSLMLAQ